MNIVRMFFLKLLLIVFLTAFLSCAHQTPKQARKELLVYKGFVYGPYITKNIVRVVKEQK